MPLPIMVKLLHRAALGKMLNVFTSCLLFVLVLVFSFATSLMTSKQRRSNPHFHRPSAFLTPPASSAPTKNLHSRRKNWWLGTKLLGPNFVIPPLTTPRPMASLSAVLVLSNPLCNASLPTTLSSLKTGKNQFVLFSSTSTPASTAIAATPPLCSCSAVSQLGLTAEQDK